MSDTKETDSGVPISDSSSIDALILMEVRFPPQSEATWEHLIGWKLCSRCVTLLFKFRSGRHIADLPRNIRKRRDKGCRFCGVLCEAAVWAEIWPNVQPKGESEEIPTVEVLSLSSVSMTTRDGGCMISIEDDFIPRPVDEITPTNPLLAEDISFASNQLNNCLSNPTHDCEPLMAEDEALWPTRVLQICERSIILLDFDADTMPGQYAALSYCWGSASELGSNPPYKASASTIQALRSGVDTSKLPLTIQQALWVCRKLEIGYIWVDSLCIIQDSLQDWEVEATKMATVYSMSKVTIIAATSTSCHSGFLGVERRQDQLRASLDSPFQLTVTPVCISGFHKDNFVGHPHDPLDTRGWTLQEEVLSSRYIKFTKDDIQWRCNAGSTCLCGQPPNKAYRSIWQVSNPTNLDARSWENLVQEFSHRLFTKDTDKLISLSSLARKMAPRFPALDGQTPYIAGLWRSSLINHLNWHTGDELGRIPDSYVAPSFSWASLSFCRRGVTFSPILKHVLCQVLYANTTPVYQGNEFGAVSGGTISLYGPHIHATVQFQEGEPDMTIRQEMSPELEVKHITLDCPLRKRILDDGGITLERSMSPTQQETGEFSVSVLILGQSGKLHFKFPQSFIIDYIHCLILGYGGNGKYQRLGKAVLRYADREAKFSVEDFESLRREVVIV